MKRTDIQRILIIGAGPIVIGQACEFDYSGSQACRALIEEGYEVVLINSNPATIMTDPDLATRTYIEPITPEIVTKIIQKERPNALLPTMGGQTALNVAHELYKAGVLDEYNVELIGANFNAINTAEDREAFKQVVESLGLESLYSETVNTLDEAHRAIENTGFPVIIRPAFTLGGSGGSIVHHPEEFEAAIQHGISLSPIDQILMEESALGWKEYEFEVMRDARDNVVIVCSVENVDPMGVHTGDSITVAPAQTLSDREYHMLRNASLDIIRKVGVDAGGCNIQFAIHPKTGRCVVIEMNPRVSRSSALVSKATGVPIAKISAKLSVGMTLDEIQNDITKTTPACFEPAIDYVVTKIPRFAFEKFPGSKPELSPQMKSVGEVMAIGTTFQESFQKALRGLETGLTGFHFNREPVDRETLLAKLKEPSVKRFHWIYQALHEDVSIHEIAEITGVDPWFLENFREITNQEKKLATQTLTSLSEADLHQAKIKGFSDEQICRLIGAENQKEIANLRKKYSIAPVYKAVDTCAGEFKAETPYFYSTYDGIENEAIDTFGHKKKIAIIGGGPNRIGQGIEFDYCCVHAAFALEEMGYAPIMINSNPETVSTDYDISDRLYFEPLTPEDLLNLFEEEQVDGVITQLGGQTPLNLVETLRYEPVNLLGTSAESIDRAENRDKFSQVLKKLELKSPESGIGRTEEEVLAIAKEMGFPLIVRPSYVLGGRAMKISYSEESLKSYLQEVVQVEPERPVLVERFLEVAQEVDVDAVCDGKDVFIGAILEHIEHAGVHSGDSTCVYPTQSISAKMIKKIENATRQLALEIEIKGLLNIQFAIKGDELYVLEVNPRASRTVPFVCKATNVPLVKIATRIMLGETLAEIQPKSCEKTHVAVKAPVFPFLKFKDTDPVLGPEMRSTGEVMGLDNDFEMAYAKAILASGIKFPTHGQVFVSVKDQDKPEAVELSRILTEKGFSLVATGGTAQYLKTHGLLVKTINKKHEGGIHAEALIIEGKVQLIINTPIGEEAITDDSYIRKAALLHNVPITTTLSGARAFVQAIDSQKEQTLSVKSLQEIFPENISRQQVNA